jgi:hypothetical protein
MILLIRKNKYVPPSVYKSYILFPMKVSFAIFLVLCSLSAFTQRIHIGNQIGLVASTTTGGSSVANKRYINAPAVGLDIDYKIKPDLMFSTGLSLRRKGFAMNWQMLNDTGAVIANVEQYFRTNYIAIPARIGLIHDKKFVLNANIGLIASYLLNGYTEVKEIYNAQSEPEGINNDFVKDMRKLDLCMAYEMSLGYKVMSSFIPYLSCSLERSILSTSKINPGFKDGLYNKSIILQFGINYIVQQKKEPRPVPTYN